MNNYAVGIDRDIALKDSMVKDSRGHCKQHDNFIRLKLDGLQISTSMKQYWLKGNMTPVREK